MFENVITDAKAAIGDAMKVAGWGVAIGIAALVAVFFLSLAAFVWIQNADGTVTACLSLGVFYAVVAAAAVIAAVMVRRRAAERVPPKPTANWWADPAIIASGIELVRIIGIRRIVPAVAVGIALLAALQSRPAKR